MQAGVGVQRRPDQLEHHRPRGLDQLGGRCGQPGLSHPGLAAKHHTGSAQRAGLRLRPRLFQLRQLPIAAHQRTLTRLGRRRALSHDAVMRDRFLDALHQCGRAGLQLKVVAYQHLHRVGDDDCARRGQA